MTTYTLSIGELARATGTKVETVRYYEGIGLPPPPARTGGNYRAYAQHHLERLSFIRRGRDLGFSLMKCGARGFPLGTQGRGCTGELKTCWTKPLSCPFSRFRDARFRPFLSFGD
jgi:MerR HTH family regulatory protein